jgi:deoxyadenosine/deoxycytidine kinase
LRVCSPESGTYEALLEDPDANPFLAGFYRDHARYALPTQLFFLFQRLNQVRELNQADMFKRATVADFILDKDPLFARLTLNDDELKLYHQMYAQMKPQAMTPDLVIYLQASTETLIDRVKRCGVATSARFRRNIWCACRSMRSSTVRCGAGIDREFG